MIEELRLQNFKSWKGPIQARFAPLTGFFGTNSSGKTSLWQILLLLKQTVQSHNQSRILNTGGSKSDLIDVGSVPEIIYQNGSSLNFGLTLKGTHLRTSRYKQINYDTSIGYESEKIYIKNMAYSWLFQQLPSEKNKIEIKVNPDKSYSLYLRDELLGACLPPGKCYSLPKEYRSVKRPSVDKETGEIIRFDDKLDFEIASVSWTFESLFENLYYLGPLREYPKRHYEWTGDSYSDVGIKGEFAIHVLLANGKNPINYFYSDNDDDFFDIDDQINTSTNSSLVTEVNEIPTNYEVYEPTIETRVAQWLVEMGLVHSFRIQPIGNGRLYEVRVKRHAHSPEVLMTEMGFGLSQVLPVLVLCYSCPVGSILILEQPEIHLHPAVQAALADVFIDVIKTRGVQIILESHSEHLLRRLQRRIAEKQLEVNDTALYFCEMGEDGASQLRSLELNTFGEIANWPKDFFGNMMDDILQIMEARLGE